ncbi:MAG: ATP-binding protein [Oscillospiraceae bacterium]|jgi:AAA+ ATPase superfamily predicted ATPase|nr:ATP-binding protein [Oscillospiraceae bacterium]
MFVGRENELGKLNEMYQSDRFEFAVIYGRRRVGKTTLIREFMRGKRVIFFAASESTARDNLISLSRQIGGKNTAPVFADFESALTEIFDRAEKERLVLVIDEYPYLAGSSRGISSVLQILIDHRKETSKLMLVLCGSSMSFMQEQVLGAQSPLYGRRTAQLRILPFTFFDALPFFSGFDAVQKAELYGCTGGIPEYLNKINPQKSVGENIIDLFLTPSGHFFEEPANLLKQELREPATYNAIIEAIAHGASRLNEIATKTGIESNKCAKYLLSLIALGLVSKEYPYGETGGRRGIYRLDDPMFKFWYRFVFPNLSAVVNGLGGIVYQSEVAPQLNAYMGFVFEDICKQFLFLLAKKEALPFGATSFGRWWGTNPKTKTQEEIDLMSAAHKDALFAECKWINAAVSEKVYATLKRRSELFPHAHKHFYLFAKTLFDAPLRKHQGVRLFTVDEMIQWHEKTSR